MERFITEVSIPCFLRISIHILNLHNFGLLGDRKSIPTPVDSSHWEHPVGPQRADEFRCRTDKGHFLHAPSQGLLYKQSGWPSGLRRCVQVAVSLESWVRIPLLTRASDTGGPRPTSSGLLSQCERPYLHVLPVLEFLACTALKRSNLAMLWDTAVSFTSREVSPFS